MIDHCLVVMGMHRSGTSCLAGTVEQCGVRLGTVFTENPFNKKGNRESADIQALNNDVLASNGGTWDRPVEVTDWDDGLRARREAAIEPIRSKASKWWGFKDPRTVLTLPFWIEALDSPSFIGTYRHPYRVALSLNRRDGMAIEDAYGLWLAYNRKLLEWMDRFHFALVDFDLPDNDYQKDLEHKLSRLGLTNNSDHVFFDRALRTQSGRNPDEFELSDEVAETYSELRDRHDAV